MRAAPPPRRWTGLVAETRSLGWGTLVEVPDRLHLAGAVCQPWVGNVVFTPIPPERFASYSQPDMVKIVWTLEAEPLGAERTRLATETRVEPTDLAARRKFRRSGARPEWESCSFAGSDYRPCDARRSVVGSKCAARATPHGPRSISM
jgi:hypothetical protein